MSSGDVTDNGGSRGKAQADKASRSIRDVASYGKYYFMHDCMFIETKIKKTQDPTGNGKNVSVKKEEVDLDEGNCYY